MQTSVLVALRVSVVALLGCLYDARVTTVEVSAGAHNLADWHDACLHSLGVRTHRSSDMWVCEEKAPFIYLSAITLSSNHSAQRSRLERLVEQRGDAIAVCDCWSRLELHDLGFEVFEEEAWYLRNVGSSSSEADVERVVDPGGLAEFEHASTAGFETPELHELEPFGVYGRSVLDDPRIRVFVKRQEGRVVSGSIACISAGVIGVYAVATLPGFRRRGFGSQVTWAAVRSEPSLPSILQPSEEGAGLYRSMGFVPMGRYTKWLRLP
jgi:ribosomal protein S18 acetylase RimI-like enzyme